MFYTNIQEKKKPEENTGNEKEWDDILTYKKKLYKPGSLKNGKYYPFKELANRKYKDMTPKERFPNRPSELAVKNLFYFWISDFVLSENGKKEKLIDEIKMEIGAIWSKDSNKKDAFEEKFVALDEIKELNT